MDPLIKHHSRTCKEAKQSFDPAFSYMVFEKHACSGEKEDLSVIYDILSNLAKGAAEAEICRDDIKGKYTLIVKAVPGDVDIIVSEFLDQNLQDSFNYCVYSAFGS